MSRRSLLLVPLLGLTGCAEAIWRVDPATPPRRWATDARTQHWPKPLDINYTFWTSGRVTAEVTPAHQWWRHVHGTGWEVEVPGEREDVTTISFDGIVERYRRHYPGGEAIMTVIPSGGSDAREIRKRVHGRPGKTRKGAEPEPAPGAVAGLKRASAGSPPLRIVRRDAF